MRSILFGLLILLAIKFFYLDTKPEKLDRIPGSYHSLEFLSYARAYPYDDIPDAGFSKAFEFHKEKFLSHSSTKGNDIEAMGPLNTSGRTLTVAINPQADSVIYAGSASGGLWRSRSLGLGRSWEYVETGYPILGVSTITFAPNDSMTMYIGTGEVYNYSDTGTDGAYRSTRGSYGMGILKSVDGGKTWSKSLDWSYNEKHGVWMIKVSPLNPNILYAATTEGVYKSTDAGETWQRRLPVIMATDVEIDPRDDDKVIVSCGNLGSDRKGIYYTTDGGLFWERSESDDMIPFQGKILLARSPHDPDHLYASVGNGFSDADAMTQLLKSEDNGLSWTEVNNLDYSKWQGWFSHDVAIDPYNPENLITVGIEVYKSVDGGNRLSLQNDAGVTGGRPAIEGPDGPANYVHSDIHFVAYHPNIEDLVLLGTDGGVFLSFDNGETFRSANGGMQTTQFYNGFSVSNSDPNFAIGGLQDNSTVVFRGDDTWQRAAGGDGSWTAINQNNNDEVYASAQRLNIFTSTDNARSFTDRVTPWFLPGDLPLFIAPYVVPESRPSTIYGGARYFYRSTNRGRAWSTMNGGEMVDSGNRIYAMDVSRAIPTSVMIATVPENTKGSVLFTDDAGQTWSGNNADLPDRVPNDVALSTLNPNLGFVCYSGFDTQHVFVTEDKGQSWTAIDIELPNVPTNAIVLDEEAGILYVGTDISVYYADVTDLVAGEPMGALDWKLYSENLSSATITMDLKISRSDRKLWIATHGNGAYRGNLIDPVSSTVEELDNSLVSIYPNPCSDYLHLYSKDQVLGWTIYSPDALVILEGTERTIDLTHEITGQYFIKVKTDKSELVRPFSLFR